jgi:hypothetical protein
MLSPKHLEVADQYLADLQGCLADDSAAAKPTAGYAG